MSNKSYKKSSNGNVITSIPSQIFSKISVFKSFVKSTGRQVEKIRIIFKKTPMPESQCQHQIIATVAFFITLLILILGVVVMVFEKSQNQRDKDLCFHCQARSIFFSDLELQQALFYVKNLLSFNTTDFTYHLS